MVRSSGTQKKKLHTTFLAEYKIDLSVGPLLPFEYLGVP